MHVFKKHFYNQFDTSIIICNKKYISNNNNYMKTYMTISYMNITHKTKKILYLRNNK